MTDTRIDDLRQLAELERRHSEKLARLDTSIAVLKAAMATVPAQSWVIQLVEAERGRISEERKREMQQMKQELKSEFHEGLREAVAAGNAAFERKLLLYAKIGAVMVFLIFSKEAGLFEALGGMIGF